MRRYLCQIERAFEMYCGLRSPSVHSTNLVKRFTGKTPGTVSLLSLQEYGSVARIIRAKLSVHWIMMDDGKNS